MSLDTLPFDALSLIVENLPIEEIFHLRATCRKMCEFELPEMEEFFIAAASRPNFAYDGMYKYASPEIIRRFRFQIHTFLRFPRTDLLEIIPYGTHVSQIPEGLSDAFLTVLAKRVIFAPEILSKWCRTKSADFILRVSVHTPREIVIQYAIEARRLSLVRALSEGPFTANHIAAAIRTRDFRIIHYCTRVPFYLTHATMIAAMEVNVEWINEQLFSCTNVFYPEAYLFLTRAISEKSYAWVEFLLGFYTADTDIVTRAIHAGNWEIFKLCAHNYGKINQTLILAARCKKKYLNYLLNCTFELDISNSELGLILETVISVNHTRFLTLICNPRFDFTPHLALKIRLHSMRYFERLSGANKLCCAVYYFPNEIAEYAHFAHEIHPYIYTDAYYTDAMLVLKLYDVGVPITADFIIHIRDRFEYLNELLTLIFERDTEFYAQLFRDGLRVGDA